jgi:hypothetical protein
MGVEYRLRFDSPNPEEVVSLTARLPGASAIAPNRTFEVRAPGAPGAIPDATVRIESCGANHCLYSVTGREWLGTLIARLVGGFGAVVVEDWE